MLVSSLIFSSFFAILIYICVKRQRLPFNKHHLQLNTSFINKTFSLSENKTSVITFVAFLDLAP